MGTWSCIEGGVRRKFEVMGYKKRRQEIKIRSGRQREGKVARKFNKRLGPRNICENEKGRDGEVERKFQKKRGTRNIGKN